MGIVTFTVVLLHKYHVKLIFGRKYEEPWSDHRLEVSFSTSSLLCCIFPYTKRARESSNDQSIYGKIILDTFLSRNDQGKIQCFMVEAKHLSFKFHCIREHVKNNKIILEFYKLEDQIAYIFTKSLNMYVFFIIFFLVRL